MTCRYASKAVNLRSDSGRNADPCLDARNRGPQKQRPTVKSALLKKLEKQALAETALPPDAEAVDQNGEA